MSQYKCLRIGFTGFVIALLGAVVGFCGFYIEQRWISVAGFAIVVMGVAIGFIGIVYAWVTNGKQAIAGGFDAAKKMRAKIIGKSDE